MSFILCTWKRKDEDWKSWGAATNHLRPANLKVLSLIHISLYSLLASTLYFCKLPVFLVPLAFCYLLQTFNEQLQTILLLFSQCSPFVFIHTRFSTPGKYYINFTTAAKSYFTFSAVSQCRPTTCIVNKPCLSMSLLFDLYQYICNRYVYCHIQKM